MIEFYFQNFSMLQTNMIKRNKGLLIFRKPKNKKHRKYLKGFYLQFQHLKVVFCFFLMTTYFNTNEFYFPTLMFAQIRLTE